jgi:hypothetical protein
LNSHHVLAVEGTLLDVLEVVELRVGVAQVAIAL